MERCTLYLLPGLLCDDFVWQDQAGALAGVADIRVASYLGMDTIGAMADSILRDAPQEFAVAGHSMGGRVALEIARRAPDRVLRLALLDTGVHAKRPGEEEKRQELVNLAFRDGMAKLADRWLPPMMHPRSLANHELMLSLKAMICRFTPQQHRDQIQALLTRPEADSVLETISCPTLLACGRQDQWSPLSQHENMVARIPHAELCVMEESGHMATVESPNAVTAALRRWLSKAGGEVSKR